MLVPIIRNYSLRIILGGASSGGREGGVYGGAVKVHNPPPPDRILKLPAPRAKGHCQGRGTGVMCCPGVKCCKGKPK